MTTGPVAIIALLALVMIVIALPRAVRGAATDAKRGEQPDDSYPKGWLR